MTYHFGIALRLCHPFSQHHNLLLFRFIQRQFLADELFNSLVELHIISAEEKIQYKRSGGWRPRDRLERTKDGKWHPLRHKGDGLPRLPCSGRASHAMNVVLGVRRNVQVQHHVHVGDVQTPVKKTSGLLIKRSNEAGEASAYLLATSVAIRMERFLDLNLLSAPSRLAWSGTRRVKEECWGDGRREHLPGSFGRGEEWPSCRDSGAWEPHAGCWHTCYRTPWTSCRPTRWGCIPSRRPVKYQSWESVESFRPIIWGV